MALSASTVWEVRTTGSDLNGGGFVTGSGGTDYSQQDAAQLSKTDLAAAQNSTTVTSATSGFTATMVGNLLQIASGTNFVAGFYQIVTFTNSATIVLDRAPATAGAGSAGVGKVGGCLNSVGKALSGHVASNDIHVKAGTYTINSVSTNVASGCWAPTAGIAGDVTRIVGYQTTREDGGTKPSVVASGITAFTVVTMAAAVAVENVEFDGASLTTGRGIGTNAAGSVYSCKFKNFTNAAVLAGSALMVYNSEATGCSTSAAFQAAHFVSCVAQGNTITGFIVGSGCMALRCISANNTGATSDGFGISATGGEIVSCTAYGNGRDGFRITALAAHNDIFNCLAVGNTGWGFNASAAVDAVRMFSCAHYNNTGGGINAFITRTSGTVALTADPFISASGSNFGLNALSGGGAALRAASATTTWPGLSTTTTALDVGASQHPDTGGGSGSMFAFRGLQ